MGSNLFFPMTLFFFTSFLFIYYFRKFLLGHSCSLALCSWCAGKWIGYMYTSPLPFGVSFPSSSPQALSRVPWVHSLLISCLCYTHKSVFASPGLPVLPTTPTFPLLMAVFLLSVSVFLFHLCKWAHLYHFSRFPHMYVNLQYLIFSFWLNFTLYDNL